MGVVLRGVAKRFGDHQLFEEVSFELNAGEKVALTGRNGGGKSTLLRLMAGLERPDAGSVSASGRPALLAQHANLGGGTLLESVTPAELLDANRTLEAAQERLNDPTPGHLTAFSGAEERYRTLGGYDFEARASAVLAGLNLRPEASTHALSGGQQRRAMLAALLLSPADLLLLDEPTNHLDAESLTWLEGWLRSAAAGVLIVSHDRAFLDATVTRVAELERGRLHVYPGDYTGAMALKAELRAAQERQHEAGERKRRALEGEMRGLRSKGESAGKFNHKRAGNTNLMAAKGKAENASGTYASRAKALEKRLERMEVVEKPYQDLTRVEVPLGEVPSGPNEVLTVENLTLERGGRTLFDKLSLTLRRGEKLALTGPNGGGKSSLIAAILGRLPYTGSVTFGHGLTHYWAGQHGEELAGFATLEDALRDANGALRTQELYNLLAQLGLPPRPDFPLSSLSGGQRTRLTLARLAVTRAPLLILDEPTNHLDIQAIEALETLLADFPGTLLFASHDRRLIERMATGRLEVVGL